MARPSETQPPVDARHRLLFELGRGGMGTVYLAIARGAAGFHKLKVVKQLRDELADDMQSLNMFMDEARLSARLNHPNIVQTNEVGFDGRSYFIEMEYLEGQSLDAMLRRASKVGGCPLPLALWILAQCCAGLHYAHELRDHDGTPLRVVHRDVSPHNVFVTYEGAVKVLDFGIAKAVDSSIETRTGVVKGKATYMAPEQAARLPVDHRADIFAVGVMLWQAVARKRLYEGLSDGEIFAKLQARDIPSLRAAEPSVPGALEAIVTRALAPDPEQRWQSAQRLQIAIEEYLEESNARVGARQVATLMTDLFADRREAVRAEIEAKLKEASGSNEGVVPRLEQAPTVRATATSPTRADSHRALAAVARGRQSQGGTPAATPGSTKQTVTEAPPEKRSSGTPTSGMLVDDAVQAARPHPRPLRLWALGGVAVAVIAASAFALRPPRADAPSATSQSAAPSPRPAGSPVPCKHNAECLRDTRNTVCREGACVPLETPECKALAEPGQVEDDATIWIGAMFPQTGENAEAYGLACMQTVDLVRRDFAQIAGGLPPPDGRGATRPLGILACDDSKNERKIAEHLANEVHVAAVIGFRSSQEAIDLSSAVFLPRHVLVVAALNQSSPLTAVPLAAGPPRLVWRTTFDTKAEARPMSHIVADVIEPRLRKEGVAALRVALVRPNSTLGITLADAVVSTLRFNGKTTPENNRNYREIVYGDPNDSDKDKAAHFDEAVRALAEYAPHVVLFAGNEGDADAIIPPLEKRWAPSSKLRPSYVYNNAIVGNAILEHPTPDLRRRLYGIHPPSNTAANVKYTLHANDVFGMRMTPRDSFGSVYDAGYLVAYAAYAAYDAGAPLTGDAMGRAMSRLLPPGDSVEVGPTHIFDAFAALRAGRNVDLKGAATPLDMDPATGETPTDFVVLCVGASGANEESGLTYRFATDRMEGTWACE